MAPVAEHTACRCHPAGIQDEAPLRLCQRESFRGTAALRDTTFAGSLVARHGPERVAVALDVRGGRAVGHGWVDGDGPFVEDALTTLHDVGVDLFEVTAIDRDGLLGGPDLELYRRLVALARGSVIASAGIATLDDLRAVRSLGCVGAIIGRALYDGRISLADAIAVEA